MKLGEKLIEYINDNYFDEDKPNNDEQIIKDSFYNEIKSMPCTHLSHDLILETYKKIIEDNKDKLPNRLFIKNQNTYAYRTLINNTFGANLSNSTSLIKSRKYKGIKFKGEYTSSSIKAYEFWYDSISVYAEKLFYSKNIIFHGAPGTGKTYLAKQVAAYIVSDGKINDFNQLNNDSKKQIGFVQFHPSYDYVDFVEGLRPVINKDSSYGFKLGNGVFKDFVEEAIKFEYDTETATHKNYVFIIDEINRGDISKIFGELFFSIDPGYRGKASEIRTQYSYLHDDDKMFYIPNNIYIIGTMNDIDRSVDTLDFAMRRRFRFINLQVEDSLSILNCINNEEVRTKAVSAMNALNNVIKDIDGLSEDYFIGPAYFAKLKYMNFEELWYDCIEPLLKDYLHGLYNENENMETLKGKYFDSIE